MGRDIIHHACCLWRGNRRHKHFNTNTDTGIGIDTLNSHCSAVDEHCGLWR